MNKVTNSQLTLKRTDAFGMITLLLIIIETAFENTDLQIYDLQINRFMLVVEIVFFLTYLSTQKLDKKGLRITIAFLAIGVIAYVLLNSAIYIKFFLIAFIVSGIGYKRTFKLLFYSRMTFTLLTIMLALVGIIDKHYTVVNKSGESITGYGLGYTHPNRLASAMTYILFCYLLYNKDCLKEKKLIFAYATVIATFIITKSRTLIWCFILLGIYMLFYNIRFTKAATKKGISILGTASIPMCTLMSVGIPILLLTAHGKIQTVIYYINSAFSRRFTHIEHAFIAYPVSLFGGTYNFDMMDVQFGYAGIDNAYIRFLYSYGIIGLIMFCMLSFLCIRSLIKKKEYFYVAVCAIAAIQGLLENVYIYVGYILKIEYS